MLHNNVLNVGMDMSKVKLPQIKMKLNKVDSPTDSTHLTFSSSSILAYLGVRGFEKINTDNTGGIIPNAVPLLAYWDIFKNYYANKQEEKCKILMKGNKAYTIEDGLTYNNMGQTVVTGGSFIVVGATIDTKTKIS